LQEFLQRLPRRAEFLFVTGLAFAPLILGSLAAAFTPSTPTPLTAAHLRGLVLYEPPLLLVIGALLYARGRRPGWLGPALRWQDFPAALALVCAVYAVNLLLWALTSQVFDLREAAQRAAGLVQHGIDFPTILACSLINAVFEEVLVAGYIIATLRESRSPWFAVNVSAGIRLSYHLYQGASGVIGILPLGLLFGWWYARTGRLWPLILGHAAFDIYALSMATQSGG
jgi:uncharacterized protein